MDYMERMEKAFLNIGLPNPREEIEERRERRKKEAFRVFYANLMETWDEIERRREAELAALTAAWDDIERRSEEELAALNPTD